MQLDRFIFYRIINNRISSTTMNKHDFAKNQTKKRKKYGLKECESLLIDINCSNSDVLDNNKNDDQKREIIDYVINHHIEIRPEVFISEFNI